MSDGDLIIISDIRSVLHILFWSMSWVLLLIFCINLQQQLQQQQQMQQQQQQQMQQQQQADAAAAANAAAAAASGESTADRILQFRWGSRRRTASSVQHGQWRESRRPTRS